MDCRVSNMNWKIIRTGYNKNFDQKWDGEINSKRLRENPSGDDLEQGGGRGINKRRRKDVLNFYLGNTEHEDQWEPVIFTSIGRFCNVKSIFMSSKLA
jgi:hypothetical protein